MPGDLRAMAAIERETAIAPWSLSQFLGCSLSGDAGGLVLETAGGRIVGFAVFQRVLDEGTLMNIGVRPEQRGRGHGGRLLAAVLERMRDSGILRCLLEVRAGNVAAIGLYRRFGFIEDGVRKDYYPAKNGREDALLMSCSLENPGVSEA